MNAVLLSPAPTQHAEMLSQLRGWVDQGWLRELDYAFAAFLSQHDPDADPLLIFTAALASHQLGRGHSCLDLEAAFTDAASALALPPQDGGVTNRALQLPMSSLAQWLAALDRPMLVGDGPGATPLVRVGSRLYLRRYWQYERTVEKALRDGVNSNCLDERDLPALRSALDCLFKPTQTEEADWQKLACALAARLSFAVITGGPGTGKTTTVVKLLAVLQYLALQQVDPDGQEGRKARLLRVRLAAPTGKAAARLNASIAGAVSTLDLSSLAHGEAVRAAIPTSVTTVHRLLGSRPDTRHFKHDAKRPLALDVLVIDEASMLDLEMMASVIAALPAGARLILLGDKDQLASVEAGAVLGDVCQRADAGHYRPATADWLQRATGQSLPDAYIDQSGTPLDQAVTKLRVSHRFGAGSGIGRLAEAVNTGDASSAIAILGAGMPDLTRIPLRDASSFDRLLLGSDHGARGYSHYLDYVRSHRPVVSASREAHDDWARQVLAAHGEFQLLCALRRGPQGVEGLNDRVESLLAAHGLIPAERGEWYLGRPVLVTSNDYGLGLMNGDIGITLTLPQDGEEVTRVAFPSSDGSKEIRWILPSRLQAMETVFAMTVHKSQGSEFTHTALVLPETDTPVLTRELVYTGITRARSRFTLVTPSDDVLRHAVRHRVVRSGGLFLDRDAGVE